MCYVVAWNVTNDMCNVMFPRELIHGFSSSYVSSLKGLEAQFGPLIHALVQNYIT